MKKAGLDREDCTCPICMYIMMEPVTMPCKHSICMPCYKQTVEKANLCCPICRLRISVWARKASKTNTLVDQMKWEIIKKTFPGKVQSRLEGKEGTEDEEESDCEDYETKLRKLKELSKPGEIRQEYEAAIQKLQCQREEEAKEEERASAALIEALQQEEEMGERERIWRQEEAKEEEKASAALIKALQQEEEMGERERKKDELGRKAAQQLQNKNTIFESDESNHRARSASSSDSNSRPVRKTRGKMSKTRKQKQEKHPINTGLTLNSYFSPAAHSSSSNAKTNQASKPSGSPSGQQSNLYTLSKDIYCLSPLSEASGNRGNSSSSGEAPSLKEHSYKKVSAKKNSQTDREVGNLTLPRKDLKHPIWMKLTPESHDLFGPGSSGSPGCIGDLCGTKDDGEDECAVEFHPIATYQCTPPKKLANGSVYDPLLVRTTPIKLSKDCAISLPSSSSTCLKSSAVHVSSASSVFSWLHNGDKSVAVNFQRFHAQSKGKCLERGKDVAPPQSSSFVRSKNTLQSCAVDVNSDTESYEDEGLVLEEDEAIIKHKQHINSLQSVENSSTHSLLKFALQPGKNLKVLQTVSASDSKSLFSQPENIQEISNDSLSLQDLNSTESLQPHINVVSLRNRKALCQVFNEVEDKLTDECESENSKEKDDKYCALPANLTVERDTNDTNLFAFGDGPRTDAIFATCRASSTAADKEDCKHKIIINSDTGPGGNPAFELEAKLDQGNDGECVSQPCITANDRLADKKINVGILEECREIFDSDASGTSDAESPEKMTRKTTEQQLSPGSNKKHLPKVSKRQNVNSRKDIKLQASSAGGHNLQTLSSATKILVKNPDDVLSKDKTKNEPQARRFKTQGAKAQYTKNRGNGTLDSFVKIERISSAEAGREAPPRKQTYETNGVKNNSKMEILKPKKRRHSATQEEVVGLDGVDTCGMPQEEADHLVALKLQELYLQFDKKRIDVERFKGARDQYSLRKKTKIQY